MAGRPNLQLSTVVLGAPDPHTLAEFYQQLLGWPFGAEEDEWVTLRHPQWPIGLGFQLEPDHVEPNWPARPDDQQMQMHLDIEADDLDEAIAYAQSLGARLADFQPQDDVRVLIDPVGHPFCLWVS